MTMAQKDIEQSLALRGTTDLHVWAVTMADRLVEEERDMFLLDPASRVRRLFNSLELADEEWFAVLIGLLWGLGLAKPPQPEAPQEAQAALDQALASLDHEPRG